MNTKLHTDLSEIACRVAGLKPTYAHNVRVGGKIEFVKDSGPIRRDVRIDEFNWEPDNLKSLAKILWAAQRSHSYALAAYRLFSKIPSSGISPDGLLGGRGYIQSIKDMRKSISSAVEMMSSFTDTIQDEINAEHWNQLSDGEIDGMVQDAENIKSNPEEFIDNEFVDEDSDGDGFDSEEPIQNPSPESFEEEFISDDDGDDDDYDDYDDYSDDNHDDSDYFSQTASDSFDNAKDLKKLERREQKGPSSGLPTDGGDQGEAKTVSEMTMNTTTVGKGGYASAISRALKAYESYHASRVASGHKFMSFNEFIDHLSSSLPVDTLPGPRVEHIGPGESRTESGGYGDSFGSDDPMGEGLSSGTNMSDPIYEDWTMDGVTGQGNQSDGSTLSISSHMASLPINDGYSWLPGSSNDRNLNYYEYGLSEADTDWMRQNASPALPPGIKAPVKKVESKSLWDVEI